MSGRPPVPFGFHDSTASGSSSNNNYASVNPPAVAWNSHHQPPPPPPPPLPGSGMQQQSFYYHYGGNNATTGSHPNGNGTNSSSVYGHHHQIPIAYNHRPSPHSAIPSQPNNRLPSPSSAQHIKGQRKRGRQHNNAGSHPPSKRRDFTSHTTATTAATATTTEKYHCKACDLHLDSPAALAAHVASHITCSSAGCDYTAAPKVVKAHYQATHGKFAGTGFKTVTVAIPGAPVQRFRICVGHQPHHVQQWIADRKKRFPRQQDGSNNKDDKPQVGHVTHNDANQNCDASPSKKEATEEKGLSSLLDGYGSSSSEEDNKEAIDGGDEEKKDGLLKTPMAEECNVAGATTNSSKAADAKNPASEFAATDVSQPPTSSAVKYCHAMMRQGTCRRGKACSYSHDIPNELRLQHQKHNKQPSTRRSKPTLLQKLLIKDMDREAILTLQLLEHIVDSNFLVNLPNVEEAERDAAH